MEVHSPLKWIGGKAASADRIIAAFPAPTSYTCFVDVCGGAAHILMCKPPYVHAEIYNDLDGNLVTFWREMQRDAQAMQSVLIGLPYARSLYYEFYRSLFDGTTLSQLERAVRWFYCLRATGTGWLRKSPVGWDHRAGNVHAYRNILETFDAVQKRFRYVSIDNRDVLATIRRYDDARTFFYIDPPYFGAEHYYESSKRGFPHEEMATLLHSIKGRVALSYYPHPILDQWYVGWRRITWEQRKSSQIQIPERGDMATETLFMNYCTQVDLWSA